MNYDEAVSEAQAIVETWGARGSFRDVPMEELFVLRQRLASIGFFLAGQMPQRLIKRGTTYLERKRAIAADMYEAMSRDVKTTKVSAEAKSEATALVYTKRLKEIEAEAAVDGMKFLLDFIKQVLSALNQEIAELRDERSRGHYLDSLNDQPPPEQ